MFMFKCVNCKLLTLTNCKFLHFGLTLFLTGQFVGKYKAVYVIVLLISTFGKPSFSTVICHLFFICLVILSQLVVVLPQLPGLFLN